MADADYGLIQGFAEALKGGLGAYKEEKKSQEESAIKRRLARLQEIEAIPKIAEATGGVIPEGLFSKEASDIFMGKKKAPVEAEEPDYNEEDDESKPGLMAKPPQGLISQPMGLVAGDKIPGFVSKKEKDKQEKLNAYNVQLADKGKKAVYGPGGEIQFIDITSPEVKAEKEVKRTKEATDLERAKTELEIAKMSEKKASAGLGTELAMKALPKEKQEQIDSHGKTLAKAQTTAIQLDELHKQITDPTLDAGTKLAVAQEQVKLLNSSLGADAVGSEEVKRIAAYLDPMPNLVKGMKVGPDLNGFSKQVKASLDRQNGLITGTQNLIEKAYGRPTKEIPRPIGVPKASDAQKQDLLSAYAKEPDGPKKERILKVIRMIDPAFKGK